MIISGAKISIGDSMGVFITLCDRKYITKESPNWRSFLNALHSNCFATLNYENESVVIVVGHEESHYCKPAESQDAHFAELAREISNLYRLSQETSIRFDSGINFLNGKETLKNKLVELGLIL